MSWVGVHQGKPTVWTPPPGADPSLSEAAMLLGAAVFARTKSHEAAEKAAFSYHYQVVFTHPSGTS